MEHKSAARGYTLRPGDAPIYRLGAGRARPNSTTLAQDHHGAPERPHEPDARARVLARVAGAVVRRPRMRVGLAFLASPDDRTEDSRQNKLTDSSACQWHGLPARVRNPTGKMPVPRVRAGLPFASLHSDASPNPTHRRGLQVSHARSGSRAQIAASGSRSRRTCGRVGQ
jgi:hypothetical protein